MNKINVTAQNIDSLEKQFRVNLINSLVGFKSVHLVGTKNNSGQTNLAIFSSVTHIGSNPPLLGFISRPAAFERHTFENIKETGFFTLNQIHSEILKQAHQTSARYDKSISEFDATGLTPEFKNDFFAPFVKESAIQIALELTEIIQIKANNTVLVIGNIVNIYLPKNTIETDGFINHQNLNTLACSGLDTYFYANKISRFSYAKPNKELQII